MAIVGLISDTHGLLRPEALEKLRGCEAIVHAGDIGDAGVLSQLSLLAPLTAVRGNNDRGAWALKIPTRTRLQIAGVSIYVVHDLAELGIDAAAEGIDVVVTGHSHRPRIEEKDGVLFVNPGSAGPRRFTLPIAVGELRIARGKVAARIHELAADQRR